MRIVGFEGSCLNQKASYLLTISLHSFSSLSLCQPYRRVSPMLTLFRFSLLASPNRYSSSIVCSWPSSLRMRMLDGRRKYVDISKRKPTTNYESLNVVRSTNGWEDCGPAFMVRAPLLRTRSHQQGEPARIRFPNFEDG